jgi:FGGY-family pentulose kinase
MKSFYLGVDVGTGSVRAALFDAQGVMAASAAEPIQLWKPAPDFVEQSSENIWAMVCVCVKRCLQDAAASPQSVRGIGFDATCSLVVLDAQSQPVTVSPSGRDEQNIIVWMDHRATPQADRINLAGHAVLKYVGGVISPEMETPKLLWLKENMKETWARAARFFDLPDFLVYRATGDDTRSLCSTVCKWTYLGHEKSVPSGAVGRWDDSYFQQIGLGDLAAEKFIRIGARVRPIGERVGSGLKQASASELGLIAGTPVSVSVIDAHAGGIGMIGLSIDGESVNFDTRLALIGGTSSCHMAVSREPRFFGGIWGPYYSAMIPGYWLTEGGQSATGALIDMVVNNHEASPALHEAARKSGKSVYEILNERLDTLSARVSFPAQLTKELHVYPDFHGNRSPRANPHLRGMISGLSLSTTLDDLAVLYLATVQAVAHGTRHIIRELNAKGYRVDTLLVCGGGTKNPVFLREHADITGCRMVLGGEPESVLLGAAMLGAVASGDCATIVDAMANMSRAGRVIQPATGKIAAFHDAKYAVFLKMHDDHCSYHAMMNRDADGATGSGKITS